MCREQSVKDNDEQLLCVKNYSGKDMIDHLMNINWKCLKIIKYDDTVIEIDLWDKVCIQPIDSQNTRLVVLSKGKIALDVMIELKVEYKCEWKSKIYSIRKLKDTMVH